MVAVLVLDGEAEAEVVRIDLEGRLGQQDTPVFDVLHFVADQQIPLLKWERSEPTLESLFMEVTRK
mgnify:CR=1 FL=1